MLPQLQGEISRFFVISSVGCGVFARGPIDPRCTTRNRCTLWPWPSAVLSLLLPCHHLAPGPTLCTHIESTASSQDTAAESLVEGGWTYIKVAGKWPYLYRAVDSAGDTIDFNVIAQAGSDRSEAFPAARVIPKRWDPTTSQCGWTSGVRPR